MMPRITIITEHECQEIVFDPSQNGNLLSAMQAQGLYFPAMCGGRGACGKCAIQLLSGDLAISPHDHVYFSQDDIEAGFRLACAACPQTDISIKIPQTDEGNFVSIDSFTKQTFSIHNAWSDQNLYGIGIDIGTTTIAFALVNFDGTIQDRLTVVNKQREYGADVISRITAANAGGLQVLSQTVREQIAQGIAVLCQRNNINKQDIQKLAVVGNTTMLHLLLGLSCENLGIYPFKPVTLDFVTKQYGDLFEGGLVCDVVVLPGISTYVGADITAGILFSGLYQSHDTQLLIDIGTNGEMALAVSGKILCTATAAGPAFEGANIKCGTGSVPGAISKVVYTNGAFAIKTIGNLPPIGICGSGVVDTVYTALENGLILPDGKLNGISELVLAQREDGSNIGFYQKDIRELQLAKSAIRSGIDTLLHNAGITYEEVQTLYIAGGFGYNLDFSSGVGIGLIPGELKEKVTLIGNSALGGAVKYLLNTDHTETLTRIVDRAEEYSLSADAYFNELFIEHITFE